ncbi:hypothetical protein K438DRAFT_1984504 [Mycena galopus ATCC 62051]|nr:hypothetical protein K438DRAFT_1984504 [Mycena galopus ATCC 62051]
MARTRRWSASPSLRTTSGPPSPSPPSGLPHALHPAGGGDDVLRGVVGLAQSTTIFVSFHAFWRESLQDYKHHLPTFIGHAVADDAKPPMGSMLAFVPHTQLSLPSLLSARYCGAAGAVSVVQRPTLLFPLVS